MGVLRPPHILESLPGPKRPARRQKHIPQNPANLFSNTQYDTLNFTVRGHDPSDFCLIASMSGFNVLLGTLKLLGRNFWGGFLMSRRHGSPGLPSQMWEGWGVVVALRYPDLCAPIFAVRSCCHVVSVNVTIQFPWVLESGLAGFCGCVF